jgi:hypothetical protein
LLTVSRPLASAEIVTIATWNLNWFPGGNPTSSEAERLIHMSSAKDALLAFMPTFFASRRFEIGIALPS